MFRLWGKILKNNRMIKQHTAQIDIYHLSTTEALEYCMNEICNEFDIQKPMWFPLNQRDFQNYGRVVFRSDNFIEDIDFDAFEIEFIKEEKKKHRH